MIRFQTASLALVVTLAATPVLAAEAQNDVITHHVELVDTPPAVVAALAGVKTVTPGILKDDADSGIDLSTIVNIGKEVWSVIEANKPVVDVTYDYATALPQGVTDASSLAGFSDLQHTSYRVYGTNGFGMTVYDTTYTLVHQFGGSLGGKGQYLSTVSVIPSNVDVDWGYTVGLKVSRVGTTNVGTTLAPVGSVDMEMKFNVDTVIKHHETTTLYQFRGDSADVQSTDL